MIAKLLTLEEIQQVRNYVTGLKYVRVGDECRFVFSGEWGTPDHKQMVNKGEQVASAAYCKVYKDRDGWSTTLETGAASDDEENIARLLGIMNQ